VKGDETDAGVIVEDAPMRTWERDLFLDGAEQADLLVRPRAVWDGRGEYRAIDLPAVRRFAPLTSRRPRENTSVRVSCSLPLCGPAFAQVDPDREGRS
jgi:hypothetical protein